MKTLDIEAVQAFVRPPTSRASRGPPILDTTQSAVSLKIKRLEDGLGRRLLERTPRQVRLSADGTAFLEPARELVAAHQGAVGAFGAGQRRLVIGVSHHAVGADLPMLLAHERSGTGTRAGDPGRRVARRARCVRSRPARCRRRATARQPAARRGNPAVGVVRLDGRARFRIPSAATAAARDAGRAVQRAPHGVGALDEAGVAWTEVFVGGGVATIGAAVSAGLAVAALGIAWRPSGRSTWARDTAAALPARDVVPLEPDRCAAGRRCARWRGAAVIGRRAVIARLNHRRKLGRPLPHHARWHFAIPYPAPHPDRADGIERLRRAPR